MESTVKLLVFIIAALAACSPMAYTHGVPNLAKVDTGVWRSGQITTADGWQYVREVTHAKRLHVIKLNYENEGSDELAVHLGIDVYHLPIQPQGDQDVWDNALAVFKGPDMNMVDLAISLLRTATPDDVWLVHCTHGQDRTGFVIGVYRVLVDKWSTDHAYDEMLAHHFHPELIGIEWAWEKFASIFDD
jgi:hypothetical protein